MALFNWFKKKPEDQPEATPPQQGATPPKAPIAGAPPQTPPVVTRTARTVMPHTVKPVSLRGDTAKPQVPSARPVAAPRSISMAGGAPAPMPTIPEPIAPAEPPPVTTLPAKNITLELGDFVDRIPGSFLKQGPFDLKRRVEFQATDLYSDLARGRASVAASVISKLVPDIFTKEVSETEDVEVQLPLQKLVEQIGDFQTRTDQIAPEQVAEIETPFLQVAKEDLAKFPGQAPAKPPVAAAPPAPAPVAPPPPPAPVAPPPPIAAPAIPTVPAPAPAMEATPGPAPVQPTGPIAPPTRRTAAPIIPGKRPPATVRASVSGGKIRLSGPAIPARISPASPVTPSTTPPPAAGVPVVPPPVSTVPLPTPPPATSLRPVAAPVKPIPAPPSAADAPVKKEEKKVTRRIQIPGIQLKKPEGGTAVPPVSAPPFPPTPPTAMPAPAIKTPSPFPTAVPPPPMVAEAPAPEPPPVAAPVAPLISPEPAAPEGDGSQISLNLKAILRALPGDAVSGDLDRIDDGAQVVFPFSAVENQLSTGRVAIPLGMFVEAMPADLRRIFQGADPEAEMPIPLQEIFQNLPSNALKMRADQVVESITEEIPTPFSQKANEDAERLAKQKLEAPEEPAAPEPAPAPVAEVEAPAPAAPEPVAEPEPERAPQPVAAELPPAPEPIAPPPAPIAPPAPAFVAPPPPIAFAPPPAPAEAPTAPSIPAPVPFGPPTAKPNLAPPPPPVSFAPPPPAVEEPAPRVQEMPQAVSMPAVPPPPLQTISPEAPRPAGPAGPAKNFDQSILQAIFMSEDQMDAKVIVRKVSELPAISACLIMFGDGLTLAGNFPEEYDTPGICAMAPLLFKKIDNYAQDLKLGMVQTFTMYTSQSPISFFQHENLCLSVLHGPRGFMPGIREKLVEVTRELAKMYSETTGS